MHTIYMDIKMTFTQTLDTNATHNETNKRWRLFHVTYFYFLLYYRNLNLIVILKWMTQEKHLLLLMSLLNELQLFHHSHWLSNSNKDNNNNNDYFILQRVENVWIVVLHQHRFGDEMGMDIIFVMLVVFTIKWMDKIGRWSNQREEW